MDTNAGIETNNLFIHYSATNEKFSIETLLEGLKSVVQKQQHYQNRDVRTFIVLCGGSAQMEFQCLVLNVIFSLGRPKAIRKLYIGTLVKEMNLLMSHARK